MPQRSRGNSKKKDRRRGSGLTGRNMRVRIKNARGRKLSSTRWLDRQLNDPYVQAARKQGYRSRASFKLLQLDDRFGFLARGHRIIDLGAAPGGWTQVAVERTQPHESGGMIVAIDIQEIEPILGAKNMVLDICDAHAAECLRAALGGQADVVLSDMAAPVTGHKSTDHLRTMALCEEALLVAVETLVSGGVLVMKAFAGGAHQDLMGAIKRNFQTVRTVKPDASRSESPETYIVAIGFRRRDPKAKR